MIKIELANDCKQYEVTLLSDYGDVDARKQKTKILNLPVRKAVWKEYQGIDLVDHYLVPREDIGELLRRFPQQQLELSADVKRDIRVFEKYCTPLSEAKRHKYKEHDFAIEDHGGGQCKCHPHMKEPGQPTPDQINYVLLDRERSRTVNSFGGGLGKTLASLERAKFLGMNRMLILTTGNMFEEWVDEIAVVYPGITPFCLVGNPDRRAKMLKNNRARIVLASYGLAHEIEMDGTFNQFIFDEADLLSNPESQRFQRITPIIDATWSNPNCGMQAVTGTVHGNTIATTWFAYHLVHPYLAGTYASFKERHMEEVHFRTDTIKKVDQYGNAVYIQKHKADVVFTKNVEALRVKSAAAIIESEDTREFEEHKKLVVCPLTREQQKVFQAIRSKTLVQVRDNEIDATDLKNRFIKLLKCCESIHTINDKLSARLSWVSSKLNWTRKKLELLKSKKKKCIIFSSIRASLDSLAKEYEDCAVSYNGSMTRTEKLLAQYAFAGVKPGREEWYKKEAEKRNFRFKPGEAQFLFMILHDQTARGLNLHWQCHTSIFLTHSMRINSNTQARWRTVRKGQKHDTWEYWLVSDTHFEKMMLKKNVELQFEALKTMNTRGGKIGTPDILRALRRDMVG